MYKLIALDMDGTLLNSQKQITARTKQAIAKAREKGVKVVLASGRPIDGMRDKLQDMLNGIGLSGNFTFRHYAQPPFILRFFALAMLIWSSSLFMNLMYFSVVDVFSCPINRANSSIR